MVGYAMLKERGINLPEQAAFASGSVLRQREGFDSPPDASQMVPAERLDRVPIERRGDI